MRGGSGEDGEAQRWRGRMRRPDKRPGRGRGRGRGRGGRGGPFRKRGDSRRGTEGGWERRWGHQGSRHLPPPRSHSVVLVALRGGGAGAPARSGEGRVRAERVPPQLRLCREVRGEWDRRTQREGEGTRGEQERWSDETRNGPGFGGPILTVGQGPATLSPSPSLLNSLMMAVCLRAV